MELNLLEKNVNNYIDFLLVVNMMKNINILWIKGASLILDQFDNLIKKIDKNYNLKGIDILQFKNSYSSKLCDIFDKIKQINRDLDTIMFIHLY